MQADVFHGTGRVFAIAESGTGAGKLPERYGPWEAVKTIELIRGQPVAGVNIDEALDDIAQFGAYITDAHSRITEEAFG